MFRSVVLVAIARSSVVPARVGSGPSGPHDPTLVTGDIKIVSGASGSQTTASIAALSSQRVSSAAR